MNWNALWEWIKDNPGAVGTGIGGLIGALGISESNNQPTGYQGSIPIYEHTRNQVPYDYMQESRGPGSLGRRYFSDNIYSIPDGMSAEEAGVPEEKRPFMVSTNTAENAAQRQAQSLFDSYLSSGRGELDGYAAGGIASIAPKGQGYYLGGVTDGMGDQIPAHVDNQEPAALSDGEFVVPADVVSHLGNGNSNAGAKELYAMMERIRKDRTGNPRQGKQVNPGNYLPS